MRSVARASRAGFTLLELMIVVAIVAVVAALAAPAIGASMRERRKAVAAIDVVRVFRNARSGAIGSGAAHLARYTAGADGGRGTIDVYRGLSNRCNPTNAFAQWATVVGGGCTGNTSCRDRFTGRRFDGSSTSRAILLTLPAIAGDVDFCFEPTGTMRWRTGTTGNFSDTMTAASGTTVAGGFVFTISTGQAAATEGVVRRVVLPFGSTARILR